MHTCLSGLHCGYTPGKPVVRRCLIGYTPDKPIGYTPGTLGVRRRLIGFTNQHKKSTELTARHLFHVQYLEFETQR